MIDIAQTYRYRWQLLAGFLILLAGSVVVFLLLPKVSSLADRYAQNRLQSDKISMTENWESDLIDFRERRQELEAFFGKLMVPVPDGDEMSAVLQLVVSGAERAGVIIQRVTPLEREGREKIMVLPVGISVMGTFHNVANFVNEMEAAHRLSRVTGLRLSTEDFSSSGTVSGEVQLEMIIVQPG